MDKRTYNISVFEDTLRRINNDSTLLSAQQLSIRHQTFVPEGKVIIPPSPRFDTPASVCVSRLRSFEAAAQYMGQKVCVLNFASASNPGGGVARGSSAQEECLCRCSTLYNCLNTRDMWSRFYSPHRHAHNPLHNDDIIYTPAVQVIKDDDYHLLDAPFAVDVITCAAPNLRERPSNSYNPVDGSSAHITPAELQSLHERRARRILSVAVLHEADVLILGAFGCGAFMNDPVVVARAYANVLPDFLHHFRTIEFAVYCRPGSEENYLAFKAISPC